MANDPRASVSPLDRNERLLRRGIKYKNPLKLPELQQQLVQNAANVLEDIDDVRDNF